MVKKINNRCNKNCFKKTNPKNSRGNGDFIGNKIADKITSVSKKSSTHSEGNKANDESEAPKERYISPEKKIANY